MSDLHYFVIKVSEDQVKRFKREVCYSFELVQCENCRFRDSERECEQFSAYTSAAGDPFTPPDWFYCGYGKEKDNA